MSQLLGLAPNPLNGGLDGVPADGRIECQVVVGSIVGNSVQLHVADSVRVLSPEVLERLEVLESEWLKVWSEELVGPLRETLCG